MRAEIYNWFTEGFDTADLKEAKALLDELEVENLMTSQKLSVAIVGAGIGGLTAAATLRRVGIEVQVYEQASKFARIGAGIQQAPNAIKVLRELGLEPHLRSIAFQPERAFNREWDNGKLTNEYRMGSHAEERFGAPYLLMHRGDLHAAIAATVPNDILNLNRKLVGLEQTKSGVALIFEDGGRTQADAVIGADGVHSVVREILLGPERPRFTGRGTGAAEMVIHAQPHAGPSCKVSLLDRRLPEEIIRYDGAPT